VEKNEIKVVAQILRLSAKGSKEEELRDRCKLRSSVLEKYLSALSALGFLSLEDVSEPLFRTTKKGLDFLHMYYRLRWLLWGGDYDLLSVRIVGQLRKRVHPIYVS
jgi:predicted transcriptional regulator